MKWSATILAFLFAVQMSAQKQTDLLLELQAYPTGVIPGVKIERHVGAKSAVLLRLGYNAFDHRDLGEHDSETGGGFGFSLGYKHFFKEGHVDWHLALKNDFWWNNVDWYDDLPSGRVEGETSITVLQPTLELGHTFVNQSNLIFTPTIAFGLEWNVKTDGAPTGEGPIFWLEFR